LGNKDSRQHIAGKWLLELPELSQMRKGEVETIKAYITRQEEQYRPPYCRYEVREPRQCVFAGTTNESQFLKDQTGNRRFWIVPCAAVNRAAIARDRDQLWAEARRAFMAGEAWHIDPVAEPDIAAVHARLAGEHTEENPYLKLVADMVELRIEPIAAAKVLEDLGVPQAQRRAAGADVAKAMHALGWSWTKVKGYRVYQPPKTPGG
jgi:predicted P-loop ATPase